MSAAENIIPIVPAETKKAITSTVDLVAQYRSLVIKTQTDYQQAADALSDLKKQGKDLEEKRKAITAPLDAAKMSAMDLFRPAADAIGELERVIKGKMADFVREQDRLRREQEAAAAAAARKEQEKLLKKAEKADAQGKTEIADALYENAASVTAAAPGVAIPAAKGAHHRKQWKAKLVDKMALVKAVAEGKASPELLDFNQSVADGLAKALKSGLSIDGVEAFEDIVIASR